MDPVDMRQMMLDSGFRLLGDSSTAAVKKLAEEIIDTSTNTYRPGHALGAGVSRKWSAAFPAHSETMAELRALGIDMPKEINALLRSGFTIQAHAAEDARKIIITFSDPQGVVLGKPGSTYSFTVDKINSGAVDEHVLKIEHRAESVLKE
jgi:hypothetical protein